jgi:hypothetical protein
MVQLLYTCWNAVHTEAERGLRQSCARVDVEHQKVHAGLQCSLSR